MRALFSRVAIIVAGVLALTLMGPAANAEPYKSQANCGQSVTFNNTNRGAFFAGHYVDVSEKACHNGTFVKWASQPNISFPSSNPMGATESLSISQQPFIYSTADYSNGAQRVTYRFTVRQRVFKIPMDQEFVFYFRVYPAYTELCQGESCSRKQWN